MKNKCHLSVTIALLIGLSICLVNNVWHDKQWEALFNIFLIAVNIHSLLCIIEG